jgi:hypothetical protein
VFPFPSGLIETCWIVGGSYVYAEALKHPGRKTPCRQCCGAGTFCFRSGSDFQKVLAPAPTLALYLPFITDFILKSEFFMFFMKEYQPNSHAEFYTI